MYKWNRICILHQERETGKLRLECMVTHYRLLPRTESTKIAITAFTGMAALLIKGITLHKFAGIGVERSDLDALVAKSV